MFWGFGDPSLATGAIVCRPLKRAESEVGAPHGLTGQFLNGLSNFGIEVEEGVEAALELVFDLLAGALDGVHGNVRLVSIGQLEGCVVDFCDLALGEQTHSVDQG